MVNWSDPAEITRDAQVFSRFMHACMGLYAWEWFMSLGFEYDLITGRKKFRWPLIFYFANRYLLLGSLCGVMIGLDSSGALNCQALYIFNQISGNGAGGLASINLAIRTRTVWKNNKIVDTILLLLIMGHWSLILQGGNLTVKWVPGTGCQITKANTVIFSATYIYTMCFDLVVLVLNMVKLVELSRQAKGATSLLRERLVKLVFVDGLLYFFVAFISNVVAVVFMLLNWNAIMSIFFNVPATIAASIASGRVVRRLMNFKPHAIRSSPFTGVNVADTVIPITSYKTVDLVKCGIIVPENAILPIKSIPNNDSPHVTPLTVQGITFAPNRGPGSPSSDGDSEDLDFDATCTV